MASVGSAFEGVLSSAAYSYFLNAIPGAVQAQGLETADLSVTRPGEAFEGTSASDYVILGLGDRLAKHVGASEGFDIVQSASAVNIDGTGFRGVILTGEKNVGVTGSADDDIISGNDGNNLLKGGDGRDFIAGGDGNDHLDGGTGNDSLFGDAGNDALLGNSGDDLLDGGAGDDKLSGGDGADSLFGGDGNDTLWGDAGDDLLKGMAGDDVLFGGAGQDTLFGGEGSDTLYGGTGADTFVVEHGAAMDVDVIADFDPNQDVIDLSATGVTNVDDLVTASDGHGNTIITLPDSTKLKLIGFTPDEVDSGFFHFH